jgi:DNA-3-methyladenine glycosylase II
MNPEEHLARHDPHLARLITQFGPCPIRRETTRPPFDVLASSIVGQQLSSKAADTIRTRLANRLRVTRPFDPEHFFRRRIATLRACGLSSGKSAHVLNLARLIRRGSLRFKDFECMADEKVVETLDRLPGVGRWTAEMFLIFGLGRLDVLALDDAGLKRAARKLYGFRKPISPRSFERLGTSWRPYRSVASWYLWEYIDSDPESTR